MFWHTTLLDRRLSSVVYNLRKHLLQASSTKSVLQRHCHFHQTSDIAFSCTSLGKVLSRLVVNLDRVSRGHHPLPLLHEIIITIIDVVLFIVLIA